VRGADRIYVLEAGRVVEEGTHAALVAAGGVYADLWRTQPGPIAEVAMRKAAPRSRLQREAPRAAGWLGSAMSRVPRFK
jgi:ABC-type glutathione transport system ATPase component